MIAVAAFFEELDFEQKRAVKHDGNTVVLAGPGSGKTATLVLKVLHLLETIAAPRGVACITYNNDAVTELRKRFLNFGVSANRRLFLGTVHSFCLNSIIRPYGSLLSSEFAAGVFVASERVANALLEDAARAHVPDVYYPTYPSTIIRLRRAIACGESVSGFDDRDIKVVEAYEAELAARGLVDFEAMVTRALKLLEDHAWVRDLIAARFPWLVIDEYQDLGGPLHRMVKAAVDLAAIKVFVVGDPDQTVYGFVGASPSYLDELTARSDFETIRLKFNYRSGGDLIVASEAALAPEEPRGYKPRQDRTDRGRVEFHKAADDLQDHAAKAVAAVRECLAAGTAAHEIAIFYRQKTEILTELKIALAAADIPYIAERETKYPATPFCRWLQQAAGWALWTEERETTFDQVSRRYLELLEEAGIMDRGVVHLTSLSRLYEALSASEGESSLRDWLDMIEHRLQITELLESARRRFPDEMEAWEQLRSETNQGSMVDHRLRDFADDRRVRGRVVVTTLHSSKGRQFDVVILPGMVEGIIPPWSWNRATRRMEEPSVAALVGIRRLFYVGFTRARHVVYLIYSRGYTSTKGYYNCWGPSRFAKEIASRLPHLR